jgi:hypothetical protein
MFFDLKLLWTPTKYQIPSNFIKKLIQSFLFLFMLINFFKLNEIMDDFIVENQL